MAAPAPSTLYPHWQNTAMAWKMAINRHESCTSSDTFLVCVVGQGASRWIQPGSVSTRRLQSLSHFDHSGPSLGYFQQDNATYITKHRSSEFTFWNMTMFSLDEISIYFGTGDSHYRCQGANWSKHNIPRAFYWIQVRCTWGQCLKFLHHSGTLYAFTICGRAL